jgi:putative SOS response-associated peptidase YedK
MCGRYSLLTPPEAMRRFYRAVTGEAANFPPAYNAAPTQRLPVIAADREGRPRLTRMTWGLVPHWSPDGKPGFSNINARAETVDTRPAFRQAFERRRCLIPADGFYEWQKAPDGRKLPWRFVMADGQPFAMAGIWERWKEGQGGEQLDSFAIVVGQANPLVRPVHDRMPVILAPEDWERWLDREQSGPKELLRPFPAEKMRAYRVSTKVNNVKNSGPELIEPEQEDE